MMTLYSYTFSFPQISFLLLTAFLIGMAKTGIQGISMFVVPVMAMIFGGRESTGVMLPMLIMADICAVIYYHRHAEWTFLVKLFPSSALGVIAGTWLGGAIDDQVFRALMAAIVLVSLVLMLWMEKRDSHTIPDFWWFALLMGFLGGFTTMVGNLAGTIMALYLLSMRLPKNTYIGTGAWFFLLINLFKVPFHVFSWETIHLNSFLINLTLLPMIALGAWAGVKLVKRIGDTHYRWFVIGMTLIAAILMLV